MNPRIAYLRCIKLRKDGTEYPQFELRYKGKTIKVFFADNIAEASRITRYFLNETYGYLKIKYMWLKDKLK